MRTVEGTEKEKTMNWKRWKIGLVISIVTGVCTAFAVGAIVPTMTLREGFLICAGSVAKDLLLYLKQHPVERIGSVENQTKTP